MLRRFKTGDVVVVRKRLELHKEDLEIGDPRGRIGKVLGHGRYAYRSRFPYAITFGDGKLSDFGFCAGDLRKATSKEKKVYLFIEQIKKSSRRSGEESTSVR